MFVYRLLCHIVIALHSTAPSNYTLTVSVFIIGYSLIIFDPATDEMAEDLFFLPVAVDINTAFVRGVLVR